MPPWHEFQPISAMYAIGNVEKPVPELPAQYSKEARDFVRLCLVRDPKQRPSACQLLAHKFLKFTEMILSKSSVKTLKQRSDNNRPISSRENKVRLSIINIIYYSCFVFKEFLNFLL